MPDNSDFSQLIEHIHVPTDHQAQRLFHGRGRGFPGFEHITLDWLPPVALLTLFAEATPEQIKPLTDWLLMAIPHCQSVQLQHKFMKTGPIDILAGEVISQLVVEENDLKFHLSLGRNRNSGLFLDMRNGRQWVRHHSQNKRVLNLFSYTCGFSVAAIAGGAEAVTNMDMSSAALATGRENHRLNQQDLTKVRFEKLDIFRSFGRIKKYGPYGLLICDPPTFQKGSIDLQRDYPKILRRLDEFMHIDSELLLCMNSPYLDRSYLIEQMAQLAPRFHLCKSIAPPEVFSDAEDKGLKTLLFRPN